MFGVCTKSRVSITNPLRTAAVTNRTIEAVITDGADRYTQLRSVLIGRTNQTGVISTRFSCPITNIVYNATTR